MNNKPIIAITMGDPAGVGPEITAKALTHQEVWDCCRPFVVGDSDVMSEAIALISADLTLNAVSTVCEARFEPPSLDIVDLNNVNVATLIRGQVSASAGRASVDYIQRAVELVIAGQADGVVTSPINKAALKASSIPYIGHTELLADLTGEPRVTTMLATTDLKVVHVTRHLPFKDIAKHITHDSVLETIQLTDTGMQAMGLPRPRLAVAALNPHGGDGGLMGREEIDAIGPAVESATKEGINAVGPIPADSVFFRAIRGEFDAVVCMYHDQGHIPIKTHGFERSVTVTLGLPIVRTSVDHGTAFDIAWQGIAHEESQIEAILLAAQMASRRTGALS
ncbi:MAG: 4-hydroxythreonine-4-phosphate dehydrogenase PdxA [Chloroflexi bacterium]|nr:4-hydroxythreonine-4-phosphate dehydrogenase PdxA [Chloroflexota bacterium]